MRTPWKVCAACFAVVICVFHSAAQDRPNFLFILSDDQRPDAIGSIGNPQVLTPSLDALAARGVVLTNAYCMGSNSGAVCAPSRAMMMTGGSITRVRDHIWDLPPELETLPQRLRSAGYATFATGKWHNGKASFARSFSHGGSIFFGGMGSHTELLVHDFDPTGRYADENRRKLTRFSSEQFADEAIAFLQNHPPAQPFFAYVAFTAPHDPRTPPPSARDFYDEAAITLPRNFLPVHPFHNGEMVIRDEKLAAWPRTAEETRRHLADYYGMITHMDEQVGRLLDALAATPHGQNTIVIFASDQGLAIGSHGLMGKQNLYEHSAKAPLIMAGPGLERGTRSDALVYLLDIHATIAELAGLEAHAGDEGISLVPAVTGRGTYAGRTSLYTAYTDCQRAVRDRRWKLIVYPKINRVQLFDLEQDPDEIEDLASDPHQRHIVDRLWSQLEQWQARIGDETSLHVDQPRSSRFDFLQAERKRSGQ